MVYVSGRHAQPVKFDSSRPPSCLTPRLRALGRPLSFDNGVGRLTSGDELCVVVSLEDWKLTILDR